MRQRLLMIFGCLRAIASKTSLGTVKDSIQSASTISGASALNGRTALITSKLSTITRRTKMAKLNPVHPGEILTEEFLTPMGITKHKLAMDLGIPASRIDQIAKGKRSV